MKEIISTGFLRLDLGLGIAGLRRGQITDIFGRTNSGKSILCYTILSQAQREGGMVALIDADRSFNRFVAEAAQIEPDRIIVTTPDCAEDALEMANIFVNSAGFSAVAIDSLDSLVPLAELNQPPSEYAFHDFSELLSRWLPRLAQDLLRTNTLLLVTHSDPDGHRPVYHNLKTRLDRLAPSFHATQRLQLTRNEKSAIEFSMCKI